MSIIIHLLRKMFNALHFLFIFLTPLSSVQDCDCTQTPRLSTILLPAQLVPIELAI